MPPIRIAAITAEYNPFHNGHAFQIAKTRQAGATHIVAVMTGNYMQRGEPSLFEKHIRAHAALLGGVDLVLELPLPYSVATAERFAYGAVFLMQALGCVDMLSFGAEDSFEALLPVARVLAEDGALSQAIRRAQGGGCTFAAARQMALAGVLGKEAAAVLERPNNILAIEYLKAATRLGFCPQPLAVPRRGAMHGATQPTGHFASASALRSMVTAGLEALAPYVPPTALAVYREGAERGSLPLHADTFEAAMLPLLRGLTRSDCALLPDVSEGLENRLYAAIRQATTPPDLMTLMKTKRYTAARIRRLVLSACLGLTERDALCPPPYLRVLGLNRRGTEVLSFAKRAASLPLSQSLAKLARSSSECARFAQLEASATDLYTLAMPQVQPCGYDYTCKPVLLK